MTMEKMKKSTKDTKYYTKIINQIEKIRTKNNINWMDILRIAFRYAPEESKKLMQKVNKEDKKISILLKKLSK